MSAKKKLASYLPGGAQSGSHFSVSRTFKEESASWRESQEKSVSDKKTDIRFTKLWQKQNKGLQKSNSSACFEE